MKSHPRGRQTIAACYLVQCIFVSQSASVATHCQNVSFICLSTAKYVDSNIMLFLKWPETNLTTTVSPGWTCANGCKVQSPNEYPKGGLSYTTPGTNDICLSDKSSGGDPSLIEFPCKMFSDTFSNWDVLRTWLLIHSHEAWCLPVWHTVVDKPAMSEDRKWSKLPRTSVAGIPQRLLCSECKHCWGLLKPPWSRDRKTLRQSPRLP